MALRVLITGSSGFIGSQLVQCLRQSGWTTFGIGRRQLNEPDYLSHDLSQPIPESLNSNFDVVIHAAARSNPWGSQQQFELDNVVATQNVIDFCLKNGRPKLIFISSSSVYYRNEHQFDLTEETPLPNKHVNRYATTKRQAEELIRNYPGSWVILRPRAVFGPGDTVLLPRILHAAREGKLPAIVNKDQPVIGDLIYIDNLVDYIELAANSDIAQGVFNLTNNQPVPILDFLFEAFDRLDIPRPQRKVSASTMMFTAGLLELFHDLFMPQHEPAITRFGVHVFRYSKTFDVSRCLQQWGEPQVSNEEGLKRTVEWFQQNPEAMGRA